MKISAPGKIIFSGEHAVAYGAPALAVATGYYTEMEIEEGSDNLIHLQLPDVDYEEKRSTSTIKFDHSALDLLFDNMASETQYQPLLKHYGDLYFYSIAHFLKQYDINTTSINIRCYSDIPSGGGMGSSASTLTALSFGLHEFFSIPADKAILAREAAHAERLQHACASHIDTEVTTRGGVVWFSEGSACSKDITMDDHWCLIYTGKPETSTGQCVQKVRTKFQNSNIWTAFERVTLDFEAALLMQNQQQIHSSIINNHLLLHEIGVIPKKVSRFIHLLNSEFGVAAKISGAGSIAGDNAGYLIAYSDQLQCSLFQQQLADFCQRYNYSFFPFMPDQQGVCRCD
ncbi:MAG: hypothetical protein OXC48_09955 [Endozoicomonadaceae bacterium]|nr:hypothetical protein [Endozoicomonadaceae bacterium]